VKWEAAKEYKKSTGGDWAHESARARISALISFHYSLICVQTSIL